MRKTKIAFMGCLLTLSLLLGATGIIMQQNKGYAVTTAYDSWDDILEYNGTTGIDGFDCSSNDAPYPSDYPTGLAIQSIETGASANNSGATFVSAFTGNLILYYSPIPKQTGSTYQDKFAYRKLKFRFTDCVSGEYFDYVVHNYNPWGTNKVCDGLMSYVEYNGVKRAYSRRWSDHEYWQVEKHGENGTDILFAGQQKGTFCGRTLSAELPALYWDALTKQIRVINPNHSWGLDTVVADLDDAAFDWGKEISDFSIYNVSVSFDEVQEGEKASVVLMAGSASSFTGLGAWEGYWFSTGYGITFFKYREPIIKENTVGTILGKDFVQGKTLINNENYKVYAADYQDGFISSYIGASNVEAKYGTGEFNEETYTSIDAETKFPDIENDFNIYVRIKSSTEVYSAWTKVGDFSVRNIPYITLLSNMPNEFYIGTEYTLPSGQVKFGEDIDNVYNLTVNGPASSVYQNTSIVSDSKFIPDVKGEYTITYQGLETYAFEGSDNPNYAVYKVNAINAVDLSNYFGLNGAEILCSQNGSALSPKIKTGNGALISSNSDKTISFNQIFTGNFDLRYSILPDNGAGFNSLKFRFTDAYDSSKYFDYVLRTATSADASYTAASVEYKEETRSTKYWDPNTIYTNGVSEAYQNAFFYWGWGDLDAQAKLIYDATELAVKTAKNDVYTVASFTDGKYNWSNAFDGFENGYKVEMIMDVIDGKQGKVLVHSINGVDFSGSVVKNASLITYSEGTNTTKQVVYEDTMVLPAYAKDNTITLNYSVAGEMKNVGDTIDTSKNVDVTVVAIDYNMVKGASIRITEPSGIRFAAKILTDDITKLTTLYGADKVCLGMRIEREDGKSAEIELTNRYIDGDYTYSNGVVKSISADNYTKQYTGKAFVEITYGEGNTVRYYAIANDNTRTVAAVAEAAYNDTTKQWNATQRALLQSFFGGND